MTELMRWDRREGIELTLPASEDTVVRCTGVDEWVVELSGLPIWSTEINLRALMAKIAIAFADRDSREGITP